MITAAEIARSLYGAWRLAHGDPRGLAAFGTDAGTARRSFFAAVLTAPAYLLFAALGGGPLLTQAPLRYLVIETLGYVVGWTAFPVVMIHIANALDRRFAYTHYLSAYNWSNVLQTALFVPVAMIAMLLPQGAASFLILMATAAILLYQWFIARHALMLGPFTAAGVVILYFLLDSLATTVTDLLLRSG